MQFPQPLTLAHNVTLRTIKNQIFNSAIKLDFSPFTNILSAILASKVFFTFITQTFSLNNEDESR